MDQPTGEAPWVRTTVLEAKKSSLGVDVVREGGSKRTGLEGAMLGGGVVVVAVVEREDCARRWWVEAKGLGAL